MNRNCKICQEKITIKTIKEEAKDNKKRQRNIYKDYGVCYASGYCIKCLRKEKQGEPLIPKIPKKTYKSIEELETELKKQGYTQEEIDKELARYKHLLKKTKTK